MSVSELIMNQMNMAGQPRVSRTTQDVKMAEPPIDISSLGMLLMMMMMNQPGKTPAVEAAPAPPGAGGQNPLMGMDPMMLFRMLGGLLPGTGGPTGGLK